MMSPDPESDETPAYSPATRKGKQATLAGIQPLSSVEMGSNILGGDAERDEISMCIRISWLHNHILL